MIEITRSQYEAYKTGKERVPAGFQPEMICRYTLIPTTETPTRKVKQKTSKHQTLGRSTRSKESLTPRAALYTTRVEEILKIAGRPLTCQEIVARYMKEYGGQKRSVQRMVSKLHRDMGMLMPQEDT